MDPKNDKRHIYSEQRKRINQTSHSKMQKNKHGTSSHTEMKFKMYLLLTALVKSFGSFKRWGGVQKILFFNSRVADMQYRCNTDKIRKKQFMMKTFGVESPFLIFGFLYFPPISEMSIEKARHYGLFLYFVAKATPPDE